MNGMMWTRPGKEETDGKPNDVISDLPDSRSIAWERLGNPGWNYDNFIPYVKRAEK